ncbi:hypothetical protein QJS04_geneDACA006747 [Acorus gramineus]|uniref:RNA polymerase Rpb4/RPC9 core domain-containing protein n=1 Tax=Acorus gramineus TaxID=55184 RepID=A0AAV9B0L8_ACOGR|nr:hypothetical protein QJS04_geneDACA006747 [Acorus gramineus]
MADKGGPGMPFPTKVKKTASKPPSKAKQSSSKGKDESSSRKGASVLIDSSSSSDSDENSGKGGKGDKAGKAGGYSGMPPRPGAKVRPENPTLNVQKDLPKNAKCLMDCEAALALQGIQDHLTVLRNDPMIRIPESFDRGLQYAKSGSHYTNPSSVRELLEYPYFIICMIANICPETVEEVYALVPSLKDRRLQNEAPIRNALKKLGGLKNPKMNEI